MPNTLFTSHNSLLALDRSLSFYIPQVSLLQLDASTLLVLLLRKFRKTNHHHFLALALSALLCVFSPPAAWEFFSASPKSRFYEFNSTTCETRGRAMMMKMM
jgi:hypothetical protein